MQRFPLSACFPVVRIREGLSCSCLHCQWSPTRHPLMSAHEGGGELHCLQRQALFSACRNRYWQLDTYMLPVCTLTVTAGDSGLHAAE